VLARRGHFVAAVENRLNAEEHSLGHERVEVAARRDAELRHVDLPNGDMVSKHTVERLRRHGLPRLVVRPRALMFLRTSCFVKCCLPRKKLLRFVDLTGARCNQIVGWLRLIVALRAAA
jgi:hypothetical protein